MIILKLILLTGSLAALVLTFRSNSLMTNLITLGMLVAVVLVQFSETIKTGLLVYLVFVFMALLYGVLVKERVLMARLVMILLPALMFAYWLWLLNHWHGNTALLPILALAAGGWGIVHREALKKEWGFLIILLVDAVDSTIENLINFF